MSNTLFIILGGAIVTYLTRIGGHLVLSRFERVHPRVQAGLDAVPAAVMTTLFAPTVVHAGPNEWIAVVVAAVAAFRLSLVPMVGLGVLTLILLRYFNG